MMSECILWDKYLMPEGYGQVRIKGKTYMAHRVALAKKLGREILPGMQANHTCDVRACVNPDHLYEGDQKQNIRDCIDRGRFVSPPPPNPDNPPPIRYGVDNNKAKMTPEKVGSLRRDHETGWFTYRQLSEKYNIHTATVYQIVSRKTWKEVP